MVTYSFSPALKQAFEQIYGPPYLARILFAEIGGSQEEDLFVRLDYDGSMHANSMSAGKRREIFGAIAGTRRGLEQVEDFLRRAKISNLRSALETAVRAWGVALTPPMKITRTLRKNRRSNRLRSWRISLPLPCIRRETQR